MNKTHQVDKYSLLEKMPIFILSALTLLFGYFIVKNADWTWGDDYEFLISTAIGKMEWSLHIANLGRLYPFGHFDFNILTLIPGGGTPLAHYIWVTFTFILFVYFSFKLYKLIFDEIEIKVTYVNWLILFLFAFQFYYFYRAFFFLVYPERVILLLLSIFFYQYHLLIKYDKIRYAVIAILVSFYLLFTKETMFVVFSVVSFLGLVLNFKKLTINQKVFYCVLLAGVVAFLLIYYFVAYKTAESFYTRNSTFPEVMKFSFGSLKVLYLSLLVLLWRIIVFIKTRKQDYLVLDLMLIGGVLYGIANIILKMPTRYYYFPAVYLVLIPIVFWAVKYFNPKWVIAVMLLLTFYYWRKFPDVIYNVQSLRLNTSQNVIYLADNVKNASNVIWLENLNNEPASKGIIGYQKDIMEVYLQFFCPDLSDINIVTTNSLSGNLESGALIFYSDFNNISSLELFDENFEKVELPFIHELSIFRKK